ncbi:DUF998 domain-containing protein [Flavobacterium sp. ZS1P14]|uniref:DUF998 domain-containing protein n=1 Tax=Flavobacterium sp. ZS1P14 TaxID=3401729 RepID=UPI003AB03457
METTTIEYSGKELKAHEKMVQPRWKRITLLFVLGYEAADCLLGGILLVAAPDGRLIYMSVDIMHGVFHDFLIPGVLLFGLGILNTAAFFAVLRRRPSDWIMAGLALGGLLIWFWIEIAILQEFHWLHAMLGLPVVAGFLATFSLVPLQQTTLQKAVLYCGILSSLLYAAINIIVPMQYPGYSSASQVVSELSAIGAPTRMLWLVLATPYIFLILAFAWGILKSAGKNRPLRIAGGFMLAYGALGFLWPFASMHQREVLEAGGGTFSDTMHIALGAATEIFYLLALGFAASALGKRFRIYSIITFVAVLVFGILTFMDAPKLSTNEPTPLIGVWERINIGIFLLWVVMLATVLLRAEKNAAMLTAAESKTKKNSLGI